MESSLSTAESRRRGQKGTKAQNRMGRGGTTVLREGEGESRAMLAQRRSKRGRVPGRVRRKGPGKKWAQKKHGQDDKVAVFQTSIIAGREHNNVGGERGAGAGHRPGYRGGPANRGGRENSRGSQQGLFLQRGDRSLFFHEMGTFSKSTQGEKTGVSVCSEILQEHLDMCL